jgi:hypothetical protein
MAELDIILKMLDEQRELWKDCSEDIKIVTSQQFQIFAELRDIRDEMKELRKGRANEIENAKAEAVERAVDKSRIWVLSGAAAAGLAIFMAWWR